MWWNDYYSGAYWPMPWMVMIIFAIVCVAMMVFMMRNHGMRSHGENALDILKERFARGEIDQSEYEQRRRLLDA
jgi:putative membrane protein